MKNYFYPLDENGNVTQSGCYEVPESGDISFFTKHHPVGTQYIISDFYIESCKDSYGNYLWKVENGNIVEAQKNINLIRSSEIQKISDLILRSGVSMIPYHKILNAEVGVYDFDLTKKQQTLYAAKAVATVHRNEYYRIEGLILSANTEEDILLAVSSVNLPSTVEEAISRFEEI